jgi:hypothetical protein
MTSRSQVGLLLMTACMWTLVNPSLGLAQGSAVTNIVRSAMNRAMNDPSFSNEDLNEISRLLKDADPKMSEDDYSHLMDEIKKAHENGKGNQDPSGSGDWNLGLLQPGVTYKVKFPLTNNCKVTTKVTISYPSRIPLTGQTDITIPPKTKQDVDMTLTFDKDNPPSGNWQPGAVDQAAILELADAITVTHPSGPGGEVTTPLGVYTYVCNKMVKNYMVNAKVYWAVPSDDSGGGGGRPKPPSKPCQQLYDHGIFVADASHGAPSSCQGEIGQQMQYDYDHLFLPAKKKNPGRWSFLPDKSQLSHMSLTDLLNLKHEALYASLARGGQ